MEARARKIAAVLEAVGAQRVLKVGGCVRDQILGLPVKDIDLEVYGLEYEAIAAALRAAGMRVDRVGRQFAVLKVGEVDVAIPRRERKAGTGHRGFEVEADPWMEVEAALRRRDYTVNAIAEDFHGGRVDPYGGEADLLAGRLRAVSAAFGEDPLRVLRGVQFAARFNLQMEAATAAQCRALLGEYATLAGERVWGEWEKWAALGRWPSRGLEVLRQTGWLAAYPGLAAMDGTPQDPQWHPEGDVWAHTGHVCDAAARIAEREGLDREERIELMLAALCHDIGKPLVTERNAEGRWVSPEHAQVGVGLSEAFLAQVHAPLRYVERVPRLVAEHMGHISQSAEGPSERAVRRLANRLHPARLRLLEMLVEADHSGRPPLEGGRPMRGWLEVAERLRAADTRPKPVLLGRHLMAEGWAAGPRMGKCLRAAYEAQLDGAFVDVGGGLEWVRGWRDVD